MWIVSLIFGNLLLVPIWYCIRQYGYSLGMMAFIIALSVASNLVYWHAFRNAPSFIAVRYLMSAMTHFMGWMLIIFAFHEPVTVKQIAGVIMVISGGILVK